MWAAVALSTTVGLPAFLAHLSYRADPQRLGRLLDVVRIGLDRRITERCSKAIEQLGREKAAVRLGAICSLERLAQEHVGHRQTVVDVFCSYLRLPFEPPEPGLPAAPDNAEVRAGLEVRRAIQGMFWEHLGDPDQRPVEPKRWADMDLNLSRTTLAAPMLRSPAVRSSNCDFGGDMVLRNVDRGTL